MNDWLLYAFLAAPTLALIYVHRPFGRLFAALFMRRGLVIGPWVWGKRRGKGLPLRPKRFGKGWSVTFGKGDQLHAVLDYGAKIDPAATALRWHYKAEVQHAHPAEVPTRPALVSLVIQRKGDNWTGEGKYEGFRLYSPAFPLETGEHIRAIPLTGWTGVFGQPGDVRAVLADLSNIAVAFGHSGGRMHGISGVGTFTLVSLEAA